MGQSRIATVLALALLAMALAFVLSPPAGARSSAASSVTSSGTAAHRLGHVLAHLHGTPVRATASPGIAKRSHKVKRRVLFPRGRGAGRAVATARRDWFQGSAVRPLLGSVYRGLGRHDALGNAPPGGDSA